MENKSAKQCVCDVNVEDCSQTLAVFLPLRFYAGGFARRVEGGRQEGTILDKSLIE